VDLVGCGEGTGSDDEGRPLLVGRSFRDAPAVDGQVFAWGKGERMLNDVINKAEQLARRY
jgi:ribosomal protein S12 methylthiotransferase